VNAGELVAGIDEAGRGPLAGPVFAAAVILPAVRPASLAKLNDSKKLSPAQREALFGVIKAEAMAWAITEASVAEIEELNILEATLLCMRRAIQALKLKPHRALVDGNRDPRLGLPTELIVKGDAKEPAISAASILAKVARDRHMLDLHSRYPQYGFDVHKGYGTEMHRDAILKHGPSPVHRRLFLRNIGQMRLEL
jgi:ribonuclease HII